jgi:CTP:molybdopterin cytidylyltransferase MocA
VSGSAGVAGPKIAGVILSGGASRRMGTPKALLRFRGETFLDRLIRILGGVCDPVIVVVGQHADQIRNGIERAHQVRFAVNPDPERGMLSSLQCGLALIPREADAAMFLPVDHPNLDPATVETLAAHFGADPTAVTVPTYLGEHGHPVCIARPLIDELLALPTQAKASDVIHRYVAETAYLEVPDPAVVTDVDDPAAYAELLARHL